MTKWPSCFFFLFLCSSLAAGDCIETRAAFDFGSGSTKIKVAKVDTCKRKILEVLYSQSTPLKLKDFLIKRGSSFFLQEEIINKLSAVTTKLKKIAIDLKTDRFIGVATEVFRFTENGSDALKKVEDILGIDVFLIDQKTEGHLGAIAARVALEEKVKRPEMEDKELLVWDIGGGSMQITSMKDADYFSTNGVEVYEGKLGSVVFKKMIINSLQKKDTTKVNSPNPIGLHHAFYAIDYAREYALAIPQRFREKIAKKEVVVLGISGVHKNSIMVPLKKEVPGFYNIEDVSGLVKTFAKYQDHQMKDPPFSDVQASNQLLVYGFMKSLGLKKVYVLDTNLSSALLVYPVNEVKDLILKDMNTTVK